ncbi:MAG: hypothetical protein RR212_01805 [Bacteroidales bacterium]
MKKLLFAIMLVSGIGFTTQAAQSTTSAETIMAMNDGEEYTKVEIADVPKEVTDAVAKKFENATIREAALNTEKGIYKITVATADDKEDTAFFHANGEEVTAEAK